MEPSGPSDDAHPGKGPVPPTKRLRMELVDKMPDNPKRIVFESTQQRYEIPLHRDEGLPSSHCTTSASAPRNIGAQRTVDKVPCNLKRVVFESTQERFEHQIRPDHVPPSTHGNFSDDDDFMPFPNTRSPTHISKSKDAGLRKSRRPRAGLSTGESTEGRQRNNRAASHSSTVNVRCNPSDVICTAALLNDAQVDAIEAEGFGQFLRMKVDAIENKDQLCWLLDRTDPETMVINIAPGKVLPITPWIISIVLGLPIGGQNLRMYSRKEGVTLRQRLIRDLNQNLAQDHDIHISNLQQEILNGKVNPLMKRCFFMILCNRLLLPSSSNNIGSLDIKRTMDHDLFGDVDWSQLVFNDLQMAIRTWHNRDKTQLNLNIYGCTIFLLIYYLDNIDHPSSPVDRISTPRITLYDNDLIHRLTNADTTIPLFGPLSFGSLPFKSWDTTCYADADVRGVPLQHTNRSMPQTPHCDIPRLKDLLSQPIDGLTGLRKSRVQDIFAHFDDTLYLNTLSIQQSFRNIARAHAKLSDQFRPLLHALGPPQAQSQLDDLLFENTRSFEQSLGIILRSQSKLVEQFRPILLTLSSSHCRDNNHPGDSSRTHNDHQSAEPSHHTPSSFPGHRSSSHVSFVSAASLLRSQSDEQAPVRSTTSPSSFSPSEPTGPFGSPVHCGVSPHLNSEQLPAASTELMCHRYSSFGFNIRTDVNPSKAFCTDQANTASNAPKQSGEANPTTRQDTPSVFNWPFLDDIPMFKFPAKRLIKKPSKFYSPFKHGNVSRPLPNLESSLRMHDFLCSDDSSLKRKTLMHFGADILKGRDIALSFGVGKFIDILFMDAFIKCIAEDDLNVRPECNGFRIFLSPFVSEMLKSQSMSSDTSRPPCSPELVEAIKRCLPATDLKKAKLIFLPILLHRHWSVYCINLGHSRVDVLDPMDYTSSSEATWDSRHSQVFHILMQHLSVALSLAAPRAFPLFSNWRCVPIQLPHQRDLNDSALFTMRYIEFYDGEGHGSLHTTIHPDQSREMRAEMLQYLVFHSANRVEASPELLHFRIGQSHPSYHPMFY